MLRTAVGKINLHASRRRTSRSRTDTANESLACSVLGSPATAVSNTASAAPTQRTPRAPSEPRPKGSGSPLEVRLKVEINSLQNKAAVEGDAEHSRNISQFTTADTWESQKPEFSQLNSEKSTVVPRRSAAADFPSRTSAGIDSMGSLGARQIRVVKDIQEYYDFEYLLGSGGFGVVAKVNQSKTFLPYAGKVLELSVFETDERDQLFRTIMQLLLNNEHPNLVRIVNVFQDDEFYFVVMDLCPGGTLQEFVINVSQLQSAVIEDIADQLLVAIKHLHSFGILHRDISANNVMLGNNFDRMDAVGSGEQKAQVRLVDFDLCGLMDQSGKMVAEVVEGTFGFMSPEVMLSKTWSPSSDLFAFGGVLGFLLTRELPCGQMKNEDVDEMGCDELAVHLEDWRSGMQMQRDKYLRGDKRSSKRSSTSSTSKAPVGTSASESKPVQRILEERMPSKDSVMSTRRPSKESQVSKESKESTVPISPSPQSDGSRRQSNESKETDVLEPFPIERSATHGITLNVGQSSRWSMVRRSLTKDDSLSFSRQQSAPSYAAQGFSRQQSAASYAAQGFSRQQSAFSYAAQGSSQLQSVGLPDLDRFTARLKYERQASAATDGNSVVVKTRLWKLLSWCLAKQYEARPQTVDEVFSSGFVHPEIHAPALLGKRDQGSAHVTRIDSTLPASVKDSMQPRGRLATTGHVGEVLACRRDRQKIGSASVNALLRLK